MNKWTYIALMFTAVLFSSGAYGQSSNPWIQISFKSGEEKTVANHSKFNFIGTDGKKYHGRIHIYNDSQFTFLTYFDELGPDTMRTDFIESVNYNEKPSHKRVHPLLIAAGILIVPIVVIPAILIIMMDSGSHNRWVNRSEFDVRIRYPEGPSSDNQP